MSKVRHWKWATVLVLAALVALPAAAGMQETLSFDSDRLHVKSLIGQITVESHSGSGFEVVVDTQGKDAREGAVRLEQETDELLIGFTGGAREYVDTRLKGSTSISTDNGWLSRLLGSGRIKVRGSGSGVELWTDVTIRVPDGGALELEHQVGEVQARNVDGRLELATGSGDVTLDTTRGDLAVATGSGDIRLTGVEGDEIEIATGSGDVDGERCHGHSFEIATGSGSIGLGDIDADSVEIGTGSGDVKLERVAADSVEIGTGSGDVTLAMDRLGSGEVSIGTGSGDIDVDVPAGGGLDVHAETRGGEVNVQMSGVEFSTQEDDEVRFTVGGGGTRVRLGSGNGDITIRG
jgi:hypothetical protein